MKTFRVVIGFGLLAAPIYLFLVGAAGAQSLPQSEPAPQVAAPSSRGELYTVPSAQPLQRLEDAYLRCPLLPGAERYSSIGGKRLHELVVQQAAISRKFRDSGHAQYWGRIIGSSADEESAQWLFNQLRRIGLSDVRIQSLPIPNPVWEPVEPWTVYARTAERTLPLGSAQPSYESPAAPAEGLDLEAVYIGTLWLAPARKPQSCTTVGMCGITATLCCSGGCTLEASYDREYCSLLAVANWQRPSVILRSSTNSFTQMRSAVETEWTRALRKNRTKKRLVK